MVLIGIMMRLVNKWLRLSMLYTAHITKIHGKIYSASRLEIGLTD